MSSADKHVLVVEDDPDMLYTFIDVLQGAGYTVTGAIHGRDALDKLSTGLRPCLILLDLMMPVMTGWEMYEHLAADPELAAIPVVFASAAGAPPEENGSTRPAAYLTKPIQLHVLLETVGRLCA
jgi:CheY-like chemotaxis protein